MSWCNVVMAKNPKYNLQLPKPLKEEFDTIAGGYGDGKKGYTNAAAMLLLIELTDKERDYIIKEIAVAEVRGEFTPLIERARSGALRKEAVQAGRDNTRKSSPTRRHRVSAEEGVVLPK